MVCHGAIAWPVLFKKSYGFDSMCVKICSFILTTRTQSIHKRNETDYSRFISNFEKVEKLNHWR